MSEQVQNKPIIKQYIRSLKTICVKDFPDSYSNLFDQIMGFLGKETQLSIYTGLLGLFALTSRYEFEMDEDRIPLFDIIQKSFNRLGELVNQMIANKENEDALFMMHLVCKVFYSSNQLQMCPHLMEENRLDPWIQFFKTILDMEVPANLSGATHETEEIIRRDKHIFWKIKGICSKLTYRMFVKYGNP